MRLFKQFSLNWLDGLAKKLMGEFEEMTSSYRQVDTLGQGEYGIVYLVQRKEEHNRGKLYALKMIPKNNRQPDAQISLLPQLKHPNIIQTIQVIRGSQETAIVLEYASQGDLHQHCTRTYTGLIPQPIVVNWLTQLCLALFHLHNEMHMIHRDIKTRNILVMDNGLLKLADFGVARKMERGEDFARTSVGTPYYLSPEAINFGKCDNKSDVWSLGCVMFELCSRQKPFDGKSIGELMKCITDSDCKQIPETYSRWLADLVRSMLEKNAQKRPSIQTILELQPIRKEFITLRNKYKQYENVVYPEPTLRTTKYLQRQDRFHMKIFTESLKTTKKDKSILKKVKDTVKEEETQRPKKIQRNKYLKQSLGYLIAQSKQQTQHPQDGHS